MSGLLGVGYVRDAAENWPRSQVICRANHFMSVRKHPSFDIDAIEKMSAVEAWDVRVQGMPFTYSWFISRWMG